jgi:hypothetical protein
MSEMNALFRLRTLEFTMFMLQKHLRFRKSGFRPAREEHKMNHGPANRNHPIEGCVSAK